MALAAREDFVLEAAFCLVAFVAFADFVVSGFAFEESALVPAGPTVFFFVVRFVVAFFFGEVVFFVAAVFFRAFFLVAFFSRDCLVAAAFFRLVIVFFGILQPHWDGRSAVLNLMFLMFASGRILLACGANRRERSQQDSPTSRRGGGDTTPASALNRLQPENHSRTSDFAIGKKPPKIAEEVGGDVPSAQSIEKGLQPLLVEPKFLLKPSGFRWRHVFELADQQEIAFTR
ncbi:MAG: hypothetical protein GXP27_20485 [Planctomycetes bacterium]|nr:hypothetical protein [Planctomycetota bacterium]